MYPFARFSPILPSRCLHRRRPSAALASALPRARTYIGLLRHRRRRSLRSNKGPTRSDAVIAEVAAASSCKADELKAG